MIVFIWIGMENGKHTKLAQILNFVLFVLLSEHQFLQWKVSLAVADESSDKQNTITLSHDAQ